MSARRQARASARTSVTQESGSMVPRVLMLGRCIEVWAQPGHFFQLGSAWQRFGVARTAWLDAAGITEIADRCRLIPTSVPWSIDPQTFTTQGGPIDDSAEDRIAEHLARADCSRRDIPALRAEASALLATVTPKER